MVELGELGARAAARFRDAAVHGGPSAEGVRRLFIVQIRSRALDEVGNKAGAEFMIGYESVDYLISIDQGQGSAGPGRRGHGTLAWTLRGM